MRLNPDVKDLFAFRYEDFTLEGYEPHPHIKAAGRGVSGLDRYPPRASRRGARSSLQFVRELAEYEKLAHECVATEAMIDAALFGADAARVLRYRRMERRAGRLRALVPEFLDLQRPSGIYLEDLFVRPAAIAARASARR